MNSDKLISIGFKPYYNHLDAIYDLKQQFENKFKPELLIELRIEKKKINNKMIFNLKSQNYDVNN